jgi:hypothetical protein
MAAAKPAPVKLGNSAFFESNVQRDEACRAIADAILILNWAIHEVDTRGSNVILREDLGREQYQDVIDFLRRVVGHQLEAYRMTLNIPYGRFYESLPNPKCEIRAKRKAV